MQRATRFRSFPTSAWRSILQGSTGEPIEANRERLRLLRDSMNGELAEAESVASAAPKLRAAIEEADRLLRLSDDERRGQLGFSAVVREAIEAFEAIH